MPSLTWLLEAFPSFPTINQLEYSLLQQECLRLSLNAQRAFRIPETSRTQVEKQLIESLDFYTAITQYPFNKNKISFVEWIEDDIFAQNLNTQKHTSKLWAEVIQTFLWQPAFHTHPLDEDMNVKTLHTHLGLFFSPESFAGLILSFCEQDYPIEKLISSGIMQDYHQYHIINMDTLQRPFIILEALSTQFPRLVNYLEQLSVTHCGIPEFHQTSLVGKISESQLHNVEIEPSPIKIDSQPILQQFLNFFDIDFIFILTLYLDKFEKHCVNHFLETWIQSQRENDLEHLYIKIRNHLHPSMHYPVFKAIGKHIPANICKNLLKNTPSLFWILLSTSPQLKEVFSKKELLKRARKHPFNSDQIDFIAPLCTKKNFYELQNSWIQKILESYLSKHDLELSHEVIQIIRANPNTKKKCALIAKKFHQELLELIDSKIFPLNESNLIDIVDEFLYQRKIITKIEQLGYECHENLKEHYDLTSMILGQLLKTQTIPQVILSLNILAQEHLHIQLTEEEHLRYKTRMIEELFKRALNTQNEIQVLQCANILIFHFEIPLKEIIQQLDEHELSLSMLATRHPEALALYLKLTPEEYRIKALLRHEHQKSLMDIALNNPRLLTVIVDELSPEQLFRLLHAEFKKAEPWWHFTGKYPAILSKILNKLSIDDKNTLLLKPNKAQQNILHESIHIAESIELVFLQASNEVKVQLCQQQNLYNQTILDLAIHYPNSFLVILKYIESEDLFTLLNATQSGQFIFEKILQNPMILDNTFQRLHQEFKLVITKRFLNSIVKNHIHQKETIKIILHQFNGLQIYRLLQTGVMEMPFIHHLMKYPETFKIAYEAILPKNRLGAIIQFKLLEKLGKSPLVNLNLLMRGISQYETFDFFKFIIANYPRLIEVMCTNQEFFKQMILFIPRSSLWEILSYTNAENESFLKYLPVNNSEILSQIIKSFPMSARFDAMIYHYESEKSLIERAIYYPESLNCLLQSIYADERELMFSQPFIENMLAKCCNFTSLLVFMRSLPPEHHIQLFALKHQKFHNILHGFFQHPGHLQELVNETNHETLAWICEKIQLQNIYLACIYQFPTILNEFFKALPNSLLTQGLLGLCYHYPNEPISRDIKDLLLEYYHPGSPQSRRWFMDTYPNVHTTIRNNISGAKKYREWIEILETNIKEINDRPARQRRA